MAIGRQDVAGGAARTTTTDELVLDRLFASAPVGLGFLDREHRYRRVNEALAAMNGRAVLDHLGRTPTQVLGDELGGPVEALLERVARTREPILGAEFTLPDGRHFVVSYTAVTRDDGDVLGVLGVVQDVTARREVELELERALDHSTRLQQVAASLSAALTVDEVAGVVVRASMEVLGGSCGVLARRERDHLDVRHRFGMAGRPPAAIPLASRLPMPEAVRQRRTVTVGSRDEWLARHPGQPPRGDFEGFVATPLLFEGRAVGCMGIGLAEARVPDDLEQALVGAVARLGAQALERARLYEERAYVATTLQRGLLPARLPQPPGIDVAVSYRPVGDGSEVGGDFYDLVELGEGGWLAAVGDVCGKGAPAAILSGLMRTTLNAVARREDDPADLLALVNRAILRHASERAEYATAVCALIHRDGDLVRARIGSAGHPPALVVRARGDLEVVASGGVMLGAADDPESGRADVALRSGDALVLYTDGVTDARVHGELFGEERLHAVLRGAAGRPAAEIADAVDSAVRRFQAGPAPDDAALLVLKPA